MAKINIEKNLIQGSIPTGLKAQFDLQLEEHGMAVGRVVEAMTRLWLNLPPEVQLRLYSHFTLADVVATATFEITKSLLEADQARLMAAECHLKKQQEDRDRKSSKPNKSAG